MGTEMNGRNSFNVVSNAVRQVSGNRCHLQTMVVHNDDSAARFLSLYNARSANVTVGTTTPDMIIQLAADATVSLDFGGAAFETALSYGITTTVPSAGQTGPTSCWVTASFV